MRRNEGERFERQRVREIEGEEAEKTKRLHGFNFGLHGGRDEARMMGEVYEWFNVRWAVGSGSAEDGLTATILAAVWPSFFVPVRMCEEAANGVNTGVFGRVIEARGKVVNDR